MSPWIWKWWRLAWAFDGGGEITFFDADGQPAERWEPISGRLYWRRALARRKP